MKLDAWRKARNLSQADLAQKIGVSSRVSVARYEGGRMPDQEILKRIIELTGGEVSANDWFDVPAESNPAPESAGANGKAL